MASRSDLRLIPMSSPVDFQVLDQLHTAFGGDVTPIRRVIESYFSGLPARLAALRTAGEDLALLSRAAHGLASPSATLGVRAIAEPCLALERVIDEGRPDAVVVASHLASIEAAIDPSSKALHHWLNRRGIAAA
jgi:HPt (histidine-containing phosphotransfer) domain-containing protein